MVSRIALIVGMVLVSRDTMAQSKYMDYDAYSPSAAEYAQDNPGALMSGKPQPASIDPELVSAAQLAVNTSQYIQDSDNAWRASFTGDCEDKALAALEWLAGQGVPRSSMRILISRATDDRPGHAILCIWDQTANPICVDVMADKPTRLSDIDGVWWRVTPMRVGQ